MKKSFLIISFSKPGLLPYLSINQNNMICILRTILLLSSQKYQNMLAHLRISLEVLSIPKWWDIMNSIFSCGFVGRSVDAFPPFFCWERWVSRATASLLKWLSTLIFYIKSSRFIDLWAVGLLSPTLDKGDCTLGDSGEDKIDIGSVFGWHFI